MDYVFVLDVSGSMANDGKMRLSQNSLKAFIDSLDQQDRLELMAFNVSPAPLWGSLQTVSDDARQQAAEFLATPAGSRRHLAATGRRGRLSLRRSRSRA